MLWATRAISIDARDRIAAGVRPIGGVVTSSWHECYHSLAHLQRTARGLAGSTRVPVVDFVDTTTGRRWRWDGRHRTSVAGRQLLELWGPVEPQPLPTYHLPPESTARPVEAPAPRQRAARGERLAAVVAVVRELDRWVTPRQVALVLGCSPSAAGAALRRAARAGLIQHNGEANRASMYHN